MYYLLLTGLIPEEQQAEFEQTYTLVSRQMPVTCAGHEIKRDQRNHDKYRFISFWTNFEEVKAFKKTPPYLMLNGAFLTLGELIESTEGKLDAPSTLS
jgi:hypothetical protein